MEQKIDSFMSQFCPFGYRDIERAIETYEKADYNESDLVGAVQEFMESTGTPMDKIDVVYVAYDALMQEARTEIERATGKDICNDDPYHHVHIVSNYLDTQLDATDENFKALRDLIDTMPTKSKVVEWLYNATK